MVKNYKLSRVMIVERLKGKIEIWNHRVFCRICETGQRKRFGPFFEIW
jgi:hypothetical protein